MRPVLKSQQGSMLLEALIAILIFSMGILALVGLQTAAVKASSDAKYRTEASQLANQLLGQMWVSDRTAATLQTNFQGGGGTDGTTYTTWLADVQNTLPGVTANPPVVIVTLNVGPTTTTSQVVITIFWKAPSEPAANAPHQYTTVAEII